MWQIIGVQCRNEWEMEAGQLLIDKSKHLDALKLAEYMVRNSVISARGRNWLIT